MKARKGRRVNKTKISIPSVRRLPSGNYFCQLRIGGKSISITDPDEDVVIAKAYAYKAGILKTRREPEDLTLRQACERYIQSKRGRLSASTIEGYENKTRNMFQTIMDRKLSRLSHRMLDEAVDEECRRTSRRGRPVSAKTIKNAYGFIRTVLHKYAPDLDADVDLPEVHRKAIVLPDADQVIHAVIGTPVELPCLLAIWLSFTMSEIRGLTKSKSLQGRYIVIQETVVRVRGEDVRKPTAKEPSRMRKAVLPDYLRRLIDKVDGDIVVPESPNSIMRRYKTALKAAGVSYISFHMLRHINVSLMSELRVPKAVARLRGGYSNDSIMESVYDNAFDSSILEADRRMNEHIGGIIANGIANEEQ